MPKCVPWLSFQTYRKGAAPQLASTPSPHSTRRSVIRRRTKRFTSTPDRPHRVNYDIRISPVRVISPDGEQIGVMTSDEAREQAKEFGLDLVEVAPDARPPVCRIMDYGKFRYELSKKKSSTADRVELKTIQLRPNTGEHDLNTKLNHAQSFLERGDKVKIVMRLRGRERALTDRWVDLIRDLITRLDDEHERGVRVLSPPRHEGRQIIAILEPGTS